jgi:hypothetical protein
MNHDGFNNACPNQGYVMASIAGVVMKIYFDSFINVGILIVFVIAIVIVIVIVMKCATC